MNAKINTYKLVVEVDYKDSSIGNCTYEGFFTVKAIDFYNAIEKVVKWIGCNYGSTSNGYRINELSEYPKVNLE